MHMQRFTKEPLEHLESVQLSTNARSRLEAIHWINAILLGLCGGLIFLVTDVLVRGM